MAQRYGLDSLAEALAYLADAVRRRLQEMSGLIHDHQPHAL